MQFIDEARIYISSGNGGKGCVSFRREKYIEFGGPNGGDGGAGGDIIFYPDAHINTLLPFRVQQHFRAENGKSGGSNNCTGKSGEDLIIKVPVGTQIFALQNNDPKNRILLYDFVSPTQKYTILKGGKGGLGNTRFKSSTNQAPYKCTEGEKGAALDLVLELKILSDVGLIGMPNAGKSTLLSLVTNARPKIADYPFTTLAPKLGIVKSHNTELVFADIPGLIEGAHQGKGLGIRFLKHIERCKILLHLIDIKSPNIYADYIKVRKELINFSDTIRDKLEIICLTKSDTITNEDMRVKRNLIQRKLNKKIHVISNFDKTKLQYFINDVAKIYAEHN